MIEVIRPLLVRVVVAPATLVRSTTAWVASPRPRAVTPEAMVTVALLALLVTIARPALAVTLALALTITPVAAPTAPPPVPPVALMPTGPVPAFTVPAPVAVTATLLVTVVTPVPAEEATMP